MNKGIKYFCLILFLFISSTAHANDLFNPGFESGTGTFADNWKGHTSSTLFGSILWLDGSPSLECPNVQHGCLNLDGTGDYINAGNLGKPANYTIMGWINPTDWGDGAIASGNSGGADATIWGIVFRDSTNAIEVWTSNGTSAQTAIVASDWSSTGYPAGTWIHLAVTVDGTNIKFYKNGTLANTIAQTVAMGGTTYNFSVGRLGEYTGAGWNFNGKIDEVVIYTDA